MSGELFERKESIEIDRKIQIPDLDLSNTKMYYNEKLNSIIILSDKEGLTIISLNGEIKFKDQQLKFDEYNIETSLFLKVTTETVSVYEIKI